MSEPSADAPEGVILALGGGVATVRVDVPVVCPRCAAGRGCGAAVGSGGGPRIVTLPVPPGRTLGIGDRVRLSLEPARLLQAAWLAWGVPLGALLAAALLGGILVPGAGGDAAAVLLASASLAAGILWARRRLTRSGCLAGLLPSLEAARRGTDRG